MFPTRRITLGGDKFRDEKSLFLDGTDGCVGTKSNFESTLFNSDFSISMWVKPTDGQPSSAEYLLGTKSGSEDNVWIRINSDGSIQFYYIAHTGNESICLSDAYFSDGQSEWVQIICTLTNGEQKIFVNGSMIKRTANSIDASTFDQATDVNLFLGARNNEGTRDGFFEGGISDVAFYTTALTSTQAKAIYNGREAYNHKEGVASNNLLSWYRMGDGSIDSFNLIGDEVNPTIGSDLVTDGGFDGDGSDWTLSNFTIGSGVATTSTNGAYISQTLSIANNVVKIVAEIKNYTGSGYIRYYSGAGADAYRRFNSNGVHTHYLRTHLGNVLFYSDSFEGSLDNVRVHIINGNPAYLVNMEATDIKGDTP